MTNGEMIQQMFPNADNCEDTFTSECNNNKCQNEEKIVDYYKLTIDVLEEFIKNETDLDKLYALKRAKLSSIAMNTISETFDDYLFKCIDLKQDYFRRKIGKH